MLNASGCWECVVLSAGKESDPVYIKKIIVDSRLSVQVKVESTACDGSNGLLLYSFLFSPLVMYCSLPLPSQPRGSRRDELGGGGGHSPSTCCQLGAARVNPGLSTGENKHLLSTYA